MRSLLLLVVQSISSVSFAADEPASKVRATLNPSGDVWVGQRIPLVVELLAPGYFSGSPTFDLPRVPGLLILPPAESPSVGSEQADGISYTVQRHELMVFSRKPGKITIPSFEIRFSFKRQPLDKEAVEQTVKTAAISFTAKPQPGSRPYESLITSSDLTVTESWDPEPAAHAKTGNAFVRTIVWTASDVPGMAFPPFDAGQITGLGIYPADPVINDTSSRGELHGERRDKVTYVCKTGGHFVIPALPLRWWDPTTQEMKSQELPAHAFTVIAPPPPPVPLSEQILRSYRLHKTEIFMTLFGAVAVISIFLKTRPFWQRLYRQLFPRHLSPLNPR